MGWVTFGGVMFVAGWCAASVVAAVVGSRIVALGKGHPKPGER